MGIRDFAEWQTELEIWLDPFLEVLGDKRRRRWAPLYLQGLIGPGDRKSIQPLVQRIAPAEHQQIHHFVATSLWPTEPLEAVLVEKADALVGGRGAYLIIDDTTLLKQGKHSVGVARQYSGAAGKRANCQTLVSLTLARDEVPLPIALRLFLPEEWVGDPERCRRAGVPEERICARSKTEIALEELDRVRERGARFDCVLADAGYGMSAKFRHGLSERALLWAVGIPKTQKVYPTTVQLLPPQAKGPGATPKHPIPSEPRSSVEDLLGALPKRAWRRIVWRQGSKQALACRFVARRVRVADGPVISGNTHAPGEELWLVGEWRSTGERKYYLSNLPARSSLRALAATLKARWSCEQAHQQMKEELGLDHFEGRSWSGLHHHALLVMIAFGFLQHLRLQRVAERGEKVDGSPSESEPARDPGLHSQLFSQESAPEMPSLSYSPLH